MNRTTLAAIALFAAAGSAAADDITVDNTTFVSGKTRAEVQAELQQYRGAGVNPWSRAYNPLATFRGEKSRAQVSAEYLQARKEVSALNGEDSGSAWLAARAPLANAPMVAGRPVNAQ